MILKEDAAAFIPFYDERLQRYFIKHAKTDQIVNTLKEGFKNESNCINYINLVRRQHGLLPYTEKYFQACLF